MDPIFTIQWPEFVLAERLRQLFPKSRGYSILIPLSRQEKDIDLVVLRKAERGGARAITLQVKASRTYMPEPPKKAETQRYRYYTWFNRFEVPATADFFLLYGLYAPEPHKTKHTKGWYRDCTLMFTQLEMSDFMSSCIAKSGAPDKMFGFGFDDESAIVQTRGNKGEKKDFTAFLFANRTELLEKHLARSDGA